MAETQEQVGGRYRILGRLGKGAMGVVFMAYDPVLDRKVAIKQMTAEIARNEDLRQRFYVEARAAARLNHPHIITIHELQEAGGEIYMVMELLEGQSLASVMEAKQAPLPLESTLDMMAQVCDGLDYAHQHAIVHRDIKPANLFLASSGVVKILDFGIARLGSLHMTATGALVGTPDYMSPEQVRGDEIDRRTDLWAVGAVLYQLLSGTKPFEGRPLAKLLMAITQAPHVPLQQRAPAVPKTVCDLVDRLLAKPRDQRPATAALVRDELRAILGRDSSIRTSVNVAEEFQETLVIVPATPAAAPQPAVTDVVAPPAASVVEPALAAAPPVSAAPKTGQAAPAPMAAKPPAAPPTPTVVAPVVAPPPVAAVPPVPAVPAAASVTAAAPVKGASAPPAVPAAAAAATPPPPQSVAPGRQPAPPSAAPGSPRRSRAGLVVAIAVLAVLGLAGTALTAWWFLGPRLLEMAGLSAPASSPVEPSSSASADVTTPQAPAATLSTPPAQAATSPEGVQSDPAAAGTAPATQSAAGLQGEPVSDTRVAEPPAAEDRTHAARQSLGQTVAPEVPSQRAAASSPARKDTRSEEPAAARPAKAASEPAAARPTKPASEPPAAEGKAAFTGARATERLTQDTVATLSGHRNEPSYGAGDAGATVAAVNRINWVLEQYAGALQRRDGDALRRHRVSVNAMESQLLAARSVSVRLESLSVHVDGTSATARCRRTIEATQASGAPLREQGTVTVSLTRRAAGWVITDIR